MEAFERQIPDRFGAHEALNELQEPTRDENLPMLRFAAEAGGKIHDRADRGVVRAPLEADHAQRRVARGEADACAELESG